MQQAAAVNVAREVLNEKTAQSQAALHDTVQNLKLAIGVLTSAPRGIEAEQALIADLEDRRAAVVQKEAELQQAIIDVNRQQCTLRTACQEVLQTLRGISVEHQLGPSALSATSRRGRRAATRLQGGTVSHRSARAAGNSRSSVAAMEGICVSETITIPTDLEPASVWSPSRHRNARR